VTDQPYARTGVAVALAAAPHALILAWMALTIAGSEGTDRSYAAFLGVFEFVLMPVALLAALAAWFLRPIRHWALPVAGVTVAAGLFVIVAAVVVGGVTG
jgi:hypothetical protein